MRNRQQMKSDIDIVNANRFVTEYMQMDDTSISQPNSPIQVYPLHTTSSLINLPTPLFRAEYNFLLLFTDGEVNQQVDNEVLNLKANDVLFVREGHLNAIQSISTNIKGYFIYIDSTLLPNLFSESSLLSLITYHPKHTVLPEDMEWMCKCVELVIQSKDDSTKLAELQTSLLKAIMLKLADSSQLMSFNPDRTTEITMLFKELVYKNFKYEREVSFYAHTLAISENYLNRCVKHITGKPPKQHLNEVVIYHSQMLLQDFSKDISQIAFELNFQDPSYFGRLFKQITKLSPTQYRTSIMHVLSE